MQILRTPNSCFANLPGYAFSPHYAELADYEGGKLRMHYLDEGPGNAAPVLLLHGEPTWSFLYRKMIPVLVAAGHRVIAPDLVGFGKSDKPTRQEDYSYERHVGWLKQLVEGLSLTEITLFGQDWGGFLGLRLAAENPDCFARIAVGNTMLLTGERDLGEGYEQWLNFSQNDPDFDIGNIIKTMGGIPDLPDDARAAYDAPFPDNSYKAGARQFPALVPSDTSDPAYEANKAAWQVLEQWQKPFITLFSEDDGSVAMGIPEEFKSRVPGAKGQAHAILKGANHFLQEQVGEELAEAINRFIAAN